MSDLRSACIEAMARAFWREHVWREEQVEDFVSELMEAQAGHSPPYVNAATAALDALLGVLEEHADEWVEASWDVESVPWPPRGMSLERAEAMLDTSIFSMLDVLREGE